MTTLGGNDIAIQISETVLTRIVTSGLAQGGRVTQADGSQIAIAEARVRAVAGDVLAKDAAIRLLLLVRTAAVGKDVLKDGNPFELRLIVPLDADLENGQIVVTVKLSAARIFDDMNNTGPLLFKLSDQKFPLPLGDLPDWIPKDKKPALASRRGSLVLTFGDAPAQVDLGVAAADGFAVAVSATMMTAQISAQVPGLTGAFFFNAIAGTASLYGAVLYQGVPADVILVLAPYQEMHWVGLRLTDFAFGPGTMAAANLLAKIAESLLALVVPPVVEPALAIGAGVGANEVKKFIAAQLEPQVQFARVTEVSLNASPPKRVWRRLRFDGIEIIAEGMLMRGDLTFGPSPYIWLWSPAAIAAAAVGTKLEGAAFFEDWQTMEKGDPCGVFRVRIVKRRTQEVVFEVERPLQRSIPWSFVHDDPASGGYDISALCLFIRRSGTLEPICSSTEAFVQLTDRLDLNHRFVQWEHMVERPAFLTRPGYGIPNGRLIEKRLSRIHRTDVAGRCRFVSEYTRDCDDPFFVTTMKTARLNYFDVLPFPEAQLAQNRAAVCDYCFFGGPDKTVPKPLP